MHELTPLRKRESLKARMEASVFSLLNSSIITDRYNLLSHTVDNAISVGNISNISKQGFNAQALTHEQGILMDTQYGHADAFQCTHCMRFQLSVFF